MVLFAGSASHSFHLAADLQDFGEPLLHSQHLPGLLLCYVSCLSPSVERQETGSFLLPLPLVLEEGGEVLNPFLTDTCFCSEYFGKFAPHHAAKICHPDHL